MLIELRDLSKNFKRGNREFSVLKDVNLSVNDGEFVYITGRSGSGKTTLLNLVAGFLHPTSGRVFFNGEDINSFDDEKISKYRNSIIGYVPQQLGMIDNLTVLENVMLPYYFFNKEGSSKERASMLLDKVGILNLKDEFPNNLSGGELKRVLIARALINNPKILILDEPTSDLDISTTNDIIKLLSKINSEGVSILMVTHELDLLKYGDMFFNVEDGKLVKGEVR